MNERESYLPWIEKYRPQKIDDIISHDQNIETIKKMLLLGSLPHLLFYGSPGTGKTSTILALAREIYKDTMNLMVMKLDASDDRGINSVREEIKGFAERKNMFQKGVKLIILDEADSMTFDAQFALRRIIEKYSENTRFCLICNYENKIIPAIRSRCANFRFSNIEIKHVTSKLKYICHQEKLNCSDETLDVISTLCRGDLRKAINLLQSVSMYDTKIDSKLCYEITGIPSPDHINLIYSNLINKNKSFNEVHTIVMNTIVKEGYSLGLVLRELVTTLLNKIDSWDPENFSKKMIELADLENMVSKSTFYDLYISYLVSIFKKIDK